MRTVHLLYRKWIRPMLNPFQQQRFKLIWTAWGYSPILSVAGLSILQRFLLIFYCLRVDWFVQHGHWPGEIARVIAAIAARQAVPGECVVEAGCWRGGSTAKLSIVAQMLGYKLLVFDSFQGVEHVPNNSFSGKYAAGIDQVRSNVRNFGEIKACKFVPGWFSQTLKIKPVSDPVRVVYIDCDLAKGTLEALYGVVPKLTEDGIIFSQDYHIAEVKNLLNNDSTWKMVHAGNKLVMDIQYRYRQLAAFRYNHEP